MQGILTLHNIRSVPQREWGAAAVREIMTPVDSLQVASLGEEALSVMERMAENDINQMPVVSEGRVVGLVARDNLIQFLRTRSEPRG